MNEKAENGFDERACEALGYLLGQFWILREKARKIPVGPDGNGYCGGISSTNWALT